LGDNRISFVKRKVIFGPIPVHFACMQDDHLSLDQHNPADRMPVSRLKILLKHKIFRKQIRGRGMGAKEKHQ
jgi:hypothetical protein